MCTPLWEGYARIAKLGKEESASMKRSKPQGRLARRSRKRPAALLMLVGVAFLCGVGVAIRRRSRTAPAGGGEGEGRQDTSARVTLVGHEFSFSGHTFRVLES